MRIRHSEISALTDHIMIPTKKYLPILKAGMKKADRLQSVKTLQTVGRFLFLSSVFDKVLLYSENTERPVLIEGYGGFSSSQCRRPPRRSGHLCRDDFR